MGSPLMADEASDIHSRRAAGPPINTSYRSAEMACSRWSRLFVKSSTIFEVSGTEWEC